MWTRGAKLCPVSAAFIGGANENLTKKTLFHKGPEDELDQ